MVVDSRTYILPEGMTNELFYKEQAEYWREIARELQAAISRIDAINDSPACFNKDINDVCDTILRPHLVNQQQTPGDRA